MEIVAQYFVTMRMKRVPLLALAMFIALYCAPCDGQVQVWEDAQVASYNCRPDDGLCPCPPNAVKYRHPKNPAFYICGCEENSLEKFCSPTARSGGFYCGNFQCDASAAGAANSQTSGACPNNMFRYTESTIESSIDKISTKRNGICSNRAQECDEWDGASMEYEFQNKRIVTHVSMDQGPEVLEDWAVKRMNIIAKPDAGCTGNPETLLEIADATVSNEWNIPVEKQKEFQCIIFEVKSTRGTATRWESSFMASMKAKSLIDQCYCHPPNAEILKCKQESSCTDKSECSVDSCTGFDSFTCPSDWECPNDQPLTLITKPDTFGKLCKCTSGASTKDHICSIKNSDTDYLDCTGFTGCTSPNAAWSKDNVNTYVCDIPGDTQKCPCPENTLTWFDTTDSLHMCGCKDRQEPSCKPSVTDDTDPKSCTKHTACATGTVYDEMECVLNDEEKNVFSVIIQGTDIEINPENVKVTYDDGTSSKATCDFDKIKVAYLREADMTTDPREVHSKIPLLLEDADKKEGAKYTRIQFTISECSSYTETSGGPGPSVHQYTAELQLGFTSWMASTIFNLRCDFSEATTTGDLEIVTKVKADVVDDAVQVEADLKILQDSQALPADGAVLGKTLELQATIKGDLGFETAFKYCKVCDKSDCLEADKKYLIGGSDVDEMNCLPEDLKSLDERFNLEVPDGTGKTFTVFKFPAFRFSSSENEKLFLECQLAICKAPGGADDSPCRQKCGARKRRSAEAAQIEPIHSTATAAIKVVAPPLPHCPSPKTVRGTSRLTCTNGTNVGSICRQDCARGFAADVKGQKTALKICQDQVTDSIGPLIFGMAPAWSPSSSRCYDVNECLENPCPSQSLCRNTLGSYYCKKQY